MAGMFYSLEEAAQRLNISQDQMKQLAREGKLREFRDGSTLLYKVDEVEALTLQSAPPQEPTSVEPIEAAEPQPAQPVEEPIELEELVAAEETQEPPAVEEPMALEELAGLEPIPLEEAMVPDEADVLGEMPGLEELSEIEPAVKAAAEEPVEPTAAQEPIELEDLPGLEEMPEPEEAQSPVEPVGVEPAGEQEAPGELEPVELAEDTWAEAAEQSAVEPAPKQPEPVEPAVPEEMAGEDEISLVPETGMPALDSDLTNADTALTGQGISVLGESDRDYQMTDDTMAETMGATGTSGTAPEASLEEIEEDVNLDTLGSGSGLLDLSLQADDTSLGGILDEIYTTEGGESEPAGGAGSVEDVAAEAESIADEVLAAPMLITPAVGRAYIEPGPDKESNVLGGLLFLPLLIVVYTAIVAVAGLREVMPSVLASIQGLIWYLMGGAFLAACVVVGAAFMTGGGSSAGARKEKKKKEKKPREKKPKKLKKGRPPASK